ncbi:MULTISPECIES: ACP phosphodiesterase [unclassified Halomonas]|uniref:acyl carrier protein phosphodiesterase n=1 Tax=unclassified Halomonas TaxID=2609666 RepID=UPI000C8F0739|nr:MULTISPECIES: ACP phosphodiesterase [unclassified Halomonas]MAR74296.1 ACP phosphodiesterase [Halomonas sp.]MBR9880148.1 DUF479 domain-containing protein [Gammaproteobacteria bacterium]MBY6111793.1 DUF479 domain-containing protein [Halomonas sp. DP1Y21-3]
MNFLAHAWLARAGDDDFLLGNLIADGVKGRDLGQWPEGVAAGIQHHRRVDAFVDRHPSVLAARRRAPAASRRVAGIALDLMWDHFLARDLATSDPHEREVVIERCYRLFEYHGAPQRLATMVPVLVREDWLRRYASLAFTCRAIAGIGSRLSGPNRLAELVPHLRDDYRQLDDDFATLWRDTRAELETSGS